MKPLVGVNYFSGWWRESPNKWEDPACPSRDWREQYINRIPINGCYDDQETMDSDILSATKYGVNFFRCCGIQLTVPPLNAIIFMNII